MSTPPASSTPRRGLPRVVVAFAVVVGIFVAAWVALAFVSLAARGTDRSTATYPAPARLHVSSGSGDVQIVAEERSDVRVDTQLRHGLWRPTASQRLSGSTLTIGGTCPAWAGVAIDLCRVVFVVRVPFATEVALEGSSGDLSVTNLRAAADLRISSGDVHALDVAGPLTIVASSGDVHVDGYRGAALTARTSSGDVDVRTALVAQQLIASASSGDVHVEVPDGPYRIAAHTQSGDQHVSLVNDPSATNAIEATTSSGDVDVEGLGD